MSFCLLERKNSSFEVYGMDYKIEAIDILLNEECILQRYYPLIQLKNILIHNLLNNGCFSKSDCSLLSDEVLIQMGLADVEMVRLFRLFLNMYDVKPSKMKEIEKVSENEEEKGIFRELYLLPGVKAVRARLYASAGYTDLFKIAGTSSETIISDTTRVIMQNELDLKVPLLKEVRTHIAVAKVLTEYKINR